MFIKRIRIISMKDKLLAIKNNPELTGTLYVTVGTLLGSFFSYLLQFFLGRMFSVEDYGSFNAFLAMSYLVGVPAAVFGTSLIKTVSKLMAKGEYKILTSLFWKLLTLSAIAGILIFFIIFSFQNQISKYLNILEFSETIFFGIFMGTTFIAAVPSAYLQGLLRYRAFGVYLISGSFVRLLLPIIFVYLGYRVNGAFLGISLAAVATVAISLIPLKKNLSEAEEFNALSIYKSLFIFSIPVAFINFGMMILNNIDMILVKSFFDSNTAGYYAGTVTLGKILLFGAGTITLVMYPKISALYSKKDFGQMYKLFNLLLKTQILVIVAGVLSFMLFPKVLTMLFFGSRFINSVQYLPRFAFFIGLYVLVNFMVFYFLAIEKTKVFMFLIPTVVAQYILLHMFNNSVESIINVNISVTAVLLLALVIYFLTTKNAGFDNSPGLQTGKNN